MNLLVLLGALLFLILRADGLGCIPKLCEKPAGSTNEIRSCEDGTCGQYEGTRFEKRVVQGVDILCDDKSFVYAPFDGDLYFWRPFAGRYRTKNGSEIGDCADTGLRIQGTNQWQGYIAFISYVKPNKYGGQVSQGQMIGWAVSPRCSPERSSKFSDHITFQLKRSGNLIDPTYHLKDCMCTGQICETNSKNEIVPPGFKAIPDYNGVKGWEIQCPTATDVEGPVGGSGSTPERPPIIYSPIDGRRIGRLRISNPYEGCENEGIFVVGRDKWNGYSVRIYNVRFLGPPDQEEPLVGIKNINQHQAIARRSACSDKDNIFMEFRKFGRLINMTDPILANNCKVKDSATNEDAED